MVESQKAIDELEGIASIEGVDLVTIGPTDLAQALGFPESEYHRLREPIEYIAKTLKKVGKAKLALPMTLPQFSLSIPELKELGVAYANCGPADVVRLLESYKKQLAEIESQL